MSDIRDKVKDESQRFGKALPELLKTLKDRWVVFKDGTVQGDYTTQTEAYTDAVKRYGIDGGFVVHKVKEQEPILLTAGVVYGVQIGC
ncbi:MAG: hypothetical protein GY847_29325 [Proteobacteria bacterium]|nr:hypothetical protein [Pseudomonadota bacterium]